MSIPIFELPWHAEMIERFTPDTGDSGLDGLARAILAAACILAQSIDEVTRELRSQYKETAALKRKEIPKK